MDISSRTASVTVQVGPGRYEENLTVTKALTLRGNAGTAAPGADPTAPEIFGRQAGGNVVTVAADNVTVDGLHLNGTVAGGALPNSVSGVYANAVNNLSVSQNTFELFSGPSVSTPGSSNVTLDANLTLSAGAAPGELDSTFGSGGKVTTAIGSDAEARAVAVQGGGKLVVAGRCLVGATYEFCLARYRSDGSVDPSFGSGGTVTSAIGNGDVVNAVALQADGKIVAAGICHGSTNEFCLARYDADGSLDPSFGSGGTVRTPIGITAFIHAVSVQADGKIVAVGSCHIGSTGQFCLARYNSDGSLDSFFGAGGTVTTAIGGGDVASGVAVQADGKIVAAGTCAFGPFAATYNFCLAHHNSDGSLDASFGSGGTVTTAIGSGDFAYGLALQGDGKIVAGGSCIFGPTPKFCLARHNPDGSLDASFGSGGTVTTAIGVDDQALDLATQSDGKILAAGACTIASTSKFCLARYSCDGSLDASFGSGGTVTTAIGSGDYAYGVARQVDGRIVAAGSCRVGAVTEFCLARYEGGGAPADANGDGVADTLQPPGTAAGAFVDSSLSPATTGSIVDNGGLSVTITDAIDPADGVQAAVGSGSGTATLSVCGGFTLNLAAGSTVVVTCGSVTVKVTSGSVAIVLGGGVTVSIPSSGAAKASGSGQDTFVIENLGSTTVTATIDGQQTPIPPGAPPTVLKTWQFVGFARPVDAAPVLNVGNAGQAVPLKWRLLTAAGAPVTNLAATAVTVTATSLSCSPAATVDQLEEVTANGSALQNLGDGYYQLNWKTPKSYAGSCKTVHLDVGEGVSHNALFKFTK